MALPGVELALRLGDDDNAHPGVLRAAVLCARTEIRSGGIGFHRYERRMAGHGVHLASQLGDPEVVDDVRGLDANPERLAHRNVNLICGDRTGRVASLPPPLVRRDQEVWLAVLGQIRAANDLSRPNEEPSDDGERNKGPRDLEPRASVRLCGFSRTSPRSKSHDTVAHQAHHDRAHSRADQEGLDEEPRDGVGLGRVSVERGREGRGAHQGGRLESRGARGQRSRGAFPGATAIETVRLRIEVHE